MKHSDILKRSDEFFSRKIKELGPTPEGSDYNSKEAQEIRFQQFRKLFDRTRTFSINDYGCGYGALAHFLGEHGYTFTYSGFDISKDAITYARNLAQEKSHWDFFTDQNELAVADYSVACGIFNLKFDADVDAWEAYILDTLDTISNISKLGFGFNMLTKYSDRDRMRHNLYYGDPLFFFDYCKKKFSRNIALLHDYNLYDFTILVRLA